MMVLIRFTGWRNNDKKKRTNRQKNRENKANRQRIVKKNKEQKIIGESYNF